jgi:hypothetical protein
MANKQTLTIIYDFKVDIGTLYDHFCDLRKYGQLHPYMKEVKIIADNSPEFIEYEVCEELKLLGFIKYCPSYKVKVFEKNKYRHLVYTSEVKKGVCLTINLYFIETGDGINFREEIEVTGNPIIVSVFLRIVKNAHDKLYSIIKQNLCRQ